MRYYLGKWIGNEEFGINPYSITPSFIEAQKLPSGCHEWQKSKPTFRSPLTYAINSVGTKASSIIWWFISYCNLILSSKVHDPKHIMIRGFLSLILDKQSQLASRVSSISTLNFLTTSNTFIYHKPKILKMS
jgi:hypothetical protein